MHGTILVEMLEEALLPKWARLLSGLLEMSIAARDTQNCGGDQK